MAVTDSAAGMGWVYAPRVAASVGMWDWGGVRERGGVWDWRSKEDELAGVPEYARLLKPDRR